MPTQEERIAELEDQLQRLVYMLDRAGMRTGATAALHGSNWEVSDSQIAQWVPGTTLPLDDTSEYVRFKNGILEVRNGSVDIQTADGGVILDADGIRLTVAETYADESSIRFMTDAGIEAARIAARRSDAGAGSHNNTILISSDPGVAVDNNTVTLNATADQIATVQLITNSGTGGAMLQVASNVPAVGDQIYLYTADRIYIASPVLKIEASGANPVDVQLTGTLTVSTLTSGKIPIASTGGLLVDGQTPLAGTKVYYVADSSGGAVTRKLTFINGILTAET